MEFAIYSIALIGGYAITRYVTEQTSFHLRVKGLWIHHWILASLLMTALYLFEIFNTEVWGLLTGIALEGLSRKNWSIKDRKQ
tara:strand:- start:2435 stop:2683 length:249 start_codon:yes stop_codon:yes gene_type:complete